MDWKALLGLAALSLISVGAKIIMARIQLRLIPAILRELASDMASVKIWIKDPQGASLTLQSHSRDSAREGTARDEPALPEGL